MHHDELDQLLEAARHGGPLADEIDALLDEIGLPVDESEVDAAALRLRATLASEIPNESPTARGGWTMTLTIGALAATALVGAGLTWLAPADHGLFSRRASPAEAVVDGAEPDAPTRYEALRTRLAEHLEDVGSEEETVALARRLAAEGRLDEAADLLEYLQVRDADSPRAPSFQRELLALLEDDGDLVRRWDAARTLIERYGPGSDWARYNPEVPGLEADLRKVAVLLHAEGRGDPRHPLLTLGAQAYQLWLRRFAGTENEHLVRYAYGELLYTQERYDEALQQYRDVATRFPDSPHARFCAEAAVRAADALVASGGEAFDARLIEAADAYARAWPDHAYTPIMLYKAAYLEHDRGHTEQAVARFEDLVARAPDSNEAGYAADLLVDRHVRAGDWAEAEAEALRLAELLDGDEDLLATASDAGYQHLRETTDELDDEAAAAAWAAWLARYPGADRRDEVEAEIRALTAPR